MIFIDVIMALYKIVIFVTENSVLQVEPNRFQDELQASPGNLMRPKITFLGHISVNVLLRSKGKLTI